MEFNSAADRKFVALKNKGYPTFYFISREGEPVFSRNSETCFLPDWATSSPASAARRPIFNQFNALMRMAEINKSEILYRQWVQNFIGKRNNFFSMTNPSWQG
jgi:hypothetical protein